MASTNYLYDRNMQQALKLSQDKQDFYSNYLKYVEQMNLDDLEANAQLSLYLDELKDCNEAQARILNKNKDRFYKKMRNSERLKQREKQIKQQDYEVYSVSGFWEVFMVLIALMFVGSLFINKFVVNKFVDGIVAAVALAIGVRSLMVKRKIIKAYHFPMRFFTIDALTVVGCFIIKMFTANTIDITFLLLVICFLFCKHNVKKLFNELN